RRAARARLLVGSNMRASFSAVTRHVHTITGSRQPILATTPERALEFCGELLIHPQELRPRPIAKDCIAGRAWAKPRILGRWSARRMTVCHRHRKARQD